MGLSLLAPEMLTLTEFAIRKILPCARARPGISRREVRVRLRLKIVDLSARCSLHRPDQLDARDDAALHRVEAIGELLLMRAADDKQLMKTIARCGRVDLLCVDELGYTTRPPRRGTAVQVLTEREEKNSVAIASNELFSGWTKTFTDPRLCAAIVDRLTFGGHIIETGTDSYRLARTAQARATAPG